jgi:FkbM family methyltransferase
VGGFRKRAKHLFERLSGYEVERFGNSSFVLLNKKQRVDAWFSRASQIRSIIEKFQVDLVIDVGANEGQFALELRSFYGGEILSFEPVASAFEKLAAAAAADPDWQVHKLALGSRASTQTINVAGRSVFSSLLKANAYSSQRFGQGASAASVEVVSVRRLDDVLEEIRPAARRIFLKLDTQGYDMEVFRGLGNWLARVVALQSEVSLVAIYEGMPHWTETIAVYETAGFGVVAMFPVTHDSGRVIEYDCLMTKVRA